MDLIVLELKRQILTCLVNDLNLEFNINQHKIYAILETAGGSPLNENLTLYENNVITFQRLKIAQFLWD